MKKDLLNNLKNIKKYFLIQIFSIILSLYYLKFTDSFYIVYLFCGAAGVITILINHFFSNIPLSKRKQVVYSTTSLLFAVCIILSNYQFFPFNTKKALLLSAYKVLWIFVGSFFASINILRYFDNLIANYHNKKYVDKLSSRKAMIICFVTVGIVELMYLFLCEFPGILTPDSIAQVKQIMSNSYTNHHPIYHTILIKICIEIGMKLFNNINVAVACYSVIQILFLDFCFSYCVYAMHESKAPIWFIVITILFFTIAPYNLSYSVTMWKDVPFAGAVLLLITSLFRLFNNKKTSFNWATLIIGSLGTCLWRSNGWIAFALFVIIFVCLLFKEYRKVSLTFLFILLFTYILVHPVLSYLNIEQPDVTESLSIPVQQIARVISYGGKLTDEEIELLSQVVDVDKVSTTYLLYKSDPIKNLICESNNTSFIISHKIEFLKVWISIGLRNPIHYVCAWIDQTRGFWNGGYNYWVWRTGVYENSYGIVSTTGLNSLLNIINSYFDLYSNSVLCLFRSIGLCTWIYIGCFAINFANKRKKQLILTIPLLAIVATLLIATPVYCEFRYAYSLFACLPMILFSMFKN